jgi:hypothetical protein
MCCGKAHSGIKKQQIPRHHILHSSDVILLMETTFLVCVNLAFFSIGRDGVLGQVSARIRCNGSTQVNRVKNYAAELSGCR